MARVELTAANKVETVNYDYPKLKLKTGETARIMAGVENPVMEYVHNLRKPVIVNGVPEMELATRKDKSTYETNKMAFVGNPLCLGDANILAEKGSDPKNCPACKLASRNPDAAQAPKRRYAMHVLRYRTKAGTTNVATPFSVELLVWAFTDRILNKLIELKEQWTSLQKHDLQLGPCTSETYQNFDISALPNAEWLTDDRRKTLTKETIAEGKIPDLTIAVGNVKKREWVEQDVAAIEEAWAEVRAYNKGNSTPDESLDDGLDGLFTKEESIDEETGEVTMMEAVGAPDGESTEDLLAGLEDSEEAEEIEEDVDPEDVEEVVEETPAPKKAAPAKKAAPKAAPTESVDNFDDLLAGM